MCLFAPSPYYKQNKGFFLGFSVGAVVECLTRDLEATGSRLTDITALWSLSNTHLFYLIELVQPRKSRPCLTERLLMGRKESNQTKASQWATPTSRFKQESLGTVSFLAHLSQGSLVS